MTERIAMCGGHTKQTITIKHEDRQLGIEQDLPPYDVNKGGERSRLNLDCWMGCEE